MKSSSSEWFVKAPWGEFKSSSLPVSPSRRNRLLTEHRTRLVSSCGDISGERVFLVHGRQDCAATFQPMLELLDNSRSYVSIDMPGSNTSDSFPIGDSRSPSALIEYITRALKYDIEEPNDGAFSLFSDATNQETNCIKKLTVDVESDDYTVDGEIATSANPMLLIDEEVANIMGGMDNSDEANGNSVETVYHTPCEESDFVVIQIDDDGVPTAIYEDKKESYSNADVDPNANLPPDLAPNANFPINDDLRLSVDRIDEAAPNVDLPEHQEQAQISVDFSSLSLVQDRTKEEFWSLPIFDVNKCVCGLLRPRLDGHSPQISQRVPYEGGGLDGTRQYFEQFIYGPVPQGGNAQNNGNIFDDPIRCDAHGSRRCPFATRVSAFRVPESGASPRDMLPPNTQKPENLVTSNQELGFQVNLPVPEPQRPPVPPRPQEKSKSANLESHQWRGNQIPMSVPVLQIRPIPMQNPPRPTQELGHPPLSSFQAPPYWSIHHPPIPGLRPVRLLEIPLPAIVVKPFARKYVPSQSAPRNGTNPQNPTDNNCPFNTPGSSQRCEHLPPGLLEHIHNFFKDNKQRPAGPTQPIYNRQSFEKGAEAPFSPIYNEQFYQNEQQRPAAPSHSSYSHPSFQYGQRLPAPPSYPNYSHPSFQIGQHRPAVSSHPTTVRAPFHVNVVPTHHQQYSAPRFQTNSGPTYAHSSMYTVPTPSGTAGPWHGQSSAPIFATFEDQSAPTMPPPPRPVTTQPLNSSLYHNLGPRPYTTIYNEYSQTTPDWTPFSFPTSNYVNPRPYSYGDAMTPLTVQTSEAPLQVSEQSAFRFYSSDSSHSPSSESAVPSPYKRHSCEKRVKIMRFHFLAAMEIAIEHLGWDKFIFIGHSMGCEIGLFFNALYPGRITKMILLDAEPTLRRLQVHDLTEFQAMFYDNYYNNYEKDNHQYRTYTVPQAKQALMKARKLTLEAASVIVSKSLIHVSGDQYRFTWDRRLKLPAPQNYPNSYYFELFSNIPPALLISASESLNAKSKYKAGSLELISMMSRLKNFQQVTVEGDHDVHLSHPERVAPYVNEFLTKSVVLPSKL